MAVRTINRKPKTGGRFKPPKALTSTMDFLSSLGPKQLARVGLQAANKVAQGPTGKGQKLFKNVQDPTSKQLVGDAGTIGAWMLPYSKIFGAASKLGKVGAPAARILTAQGLGAGHSTLGAMSENRDVTKRDVAGGIIGGTATGLAGEGVRALATKLAGRGQPKPIAPKSKDPVKDITRAIKDIKPIRKAQELSYSKERAYRFGGAEKARTSIKSEADLDKFFSKLKSPLKKVQYESMRNSVSQDSMDDLFRMVATDKSISTGETATAFEGLKNIFGAKGATLPTKSELKVLSKVFGNDFTSTVLNKRPLLQKMTSAGYEVLNVPRSIMSSFDMSAGFRQGIFLAARHPKTFFKNFAKSAKYLFSEKNFAKAQEALKNRPNYQIGKDSGLALTELSSLSNREEGFMSNLAEKIPIAGKVIRGSGRAYTGFLNKMRADVFDDLLLKSTQQGLKPTQKLTSSIAGFVNNATGRGELPSVAKDAGKLLNTMFFSPRLAMSRASLLNPMYYAKLDPFVRKEAMKTLVSFAGAATSILGVAKLAGAEVSADPTNSDFAKIKIGNTRVDILGGFQQYIRLIAQLGLGKTTSSTTGKVTDLTEGGWGQLNRASVLGKFFEYKEAPVASFAHTMLKGKSLFEDELNLGSEFYRRLTPMVIQDIVEAINDSGWQGAAFAPLPIIGVGLQTYSDKTSQGKIDWDKINKSLK